MFKAFLKKVEESTEQLGASFKTKENAPKTLDLLKKDLSPVVKKLDIIDAPKASTQPQAPPPTPIHYKEDLDLHPGATFLKKYQEKLGELHTNNVILSKKAEAVDRKLPTLVRHCTNHHEVWRRLHNEIVRLPDLSANISNIRTQIDVILVKFDEMEILLSQQVENYYANELVKYKESLVNDGNKYQLQKQKELASLEEELALSRAKYDREKAAREREQARLLRVEQAEQRRKQEAEEARQIKQKESEEKKQQEKLRSAFGNAFQHQMDQFKKFGSVIAPKKSEPVAPVEKNPQAIEEFLKDSNDGIKKDPAVESTEAPAESQETKGTEQEEEDERNALVKGDEEPETETKEVSDKADEGKDESKEVEVEQEEKATSEQKEQEEKETSEQKEEASAQETTEDAIKETSAETTEL